MMHPEPATEAMNRLAQAFVCLTEPAAKRLYDTTVLGLTLPEPPAAAPDVETVAETPAPANGQGLGLRPTPTAAAQGTVPVPPRSSPAADTQIIFVADSDTAVPPPVRRPGMTPAALTESLPAVEMPPSEDPDATPPPVRRGTSSQSLPRIDPAEELARSTAARRGLGTRRAFYLRIRHTWRLLHLWDRLGKYVASPKRRLPRPAEAGPLLALLEELQAELEDFPLILGEAGQPGYLVVNLAGQDEDRPAFHTLDLDQRRSLGRDWQRGRDLLAAHRDFLFQEVRQLPRRGFRFWTVRAIRAFVNDRPGLVFLGLALAALGIALFHTLYR
jgi:hypothetical protein